MDYIELAKIGGPTIVSIIVLLLIVREFLKFAQRQEDNFNEIIKNHLHANTESNNKLANMIEMLHKWFKNNHK